MGLGPSIKMTTRHHFRCPITERLSNDPEIDFAGIIIDGVSEVYDDKYFTAVRTADYAELLHAEGAIVAIDGWGNHHVDFVSVIEELGKKGIPSVGLSYIGQQGRLVCSNPYVDCVIDFNKRESGYESCVVGQNNLTDYDAMKATAILKNKIRRKNPVSKFSGASESDSEPKIMKRLIQKSHRISDLRFGDAASLSRNGLILKSGMEKEILAQEPRLKDIQIQIIRPEDDKHIPVHSNLDFSPIAAKISGRPGEGITHTLSGVTVMLTGVEDETGFEPSNIGSSEGFLDEQVSFDQAGTPSSDDFILHMDILFQKGEGRTAEGIEAAHRACDRYVGKIRKVMQDFSDLPCKQKEYKDIYRPGKPRIVLIKIVSGLGTMYDTVLFPSEPGGILGGWNLRECRNQPWIITGNQCRDGVIHSLL